MLIHACLLLNTHWCQNYTRVLNISLFAVQRNLLNNFGIYDLIFNMTRGYQSFNFSQELTTKTLHIPIRLCTSVLFYAAPVKLLKLWQNSLLRSGEVRQVGFERKNLLSSCFSQKINFWSLNPKIMKFLNLAAAFESHIMSIGFMPAGDL